MKRTMPIEELDNRVEELNGLFPEWSQWQQKRAKKNLQDEHGVKIEAGEWYYQQGDKAFDFYPIRYSTTSMERLINTLLADNPVLTEVSRKIREKRMARYCRATEGLTH